MLNSHIIACATRSQEPIGAAVVKVRKARLYQYASLHAKIVRTRREPKVDNLTKHHDQYCRKASRNEVVAC